MVRIGKIKQQFINLVTANHEPKQIALGVAIGVFIGITPTYGLHIWIALLVALLISKINKLAVILGTQISPPLISAFICWTNYQVGRFVLPKEYPPLSIAMLKNFTYEKFIDILIPLFVGSIIFGIVCSVIAYFLTLKIIVIIKRRKMGNISKKFDPVICDEGTFDVIERQ